MTHRTTILASFALLSLLAAACGPLAKEQSDDGGTPPPPADGATPADGGGATDAPSTPPGDGGPASDSGAPIDGGSTGDAGVSGDGGSAATCSTGTLFAGDPLYTGSDLPASGTGIRADPPLPWRNLVFDGTRVFTLVDQTVWTADLSGATPTESLVYGVDTTPVHPFKSGPCAGARIGESRGLGVLPDHSLVITDWWSNAIVHVVDPAGPTCAVEFWAGSTTPGDDVPQDYNAGDSDGPGASAKLAAPGPLAVDGAGNVFFYDSTNFKLKKMANDAQHTVSTLATIDSDVVVTALTQLGNSIYAVGVATIGSWLYSIDATSGAVTTMKDNTFAWAPLDTSSSPSLGAITNDGQGLIVSGGGYIWYVTLAGAVHVLAGQGVVADFPPSGYDPLASQPAMSLYLEPDLGGSGTAGTSTFLGYHDGALYSRGYATGNKYFVERIACP